MNKIIYLLSYPWNYFLLKLAKVKFNSYPIIYGFLFIKGKNGIIRIGENVIINSNIWSNPVGLVNSTFLCVNKNAEIIIGNNVGISNSLIYSAKKICIEDNVIIGGACQIFDNDFHSLDFRTRISPKDQESIISSPIIIKEGAFIGASSIILKGVVIGSKSIIAAGSVVTKSIPPNEIWGGNPAKFLKSLNTF